MTKLPPAPNKDTLRPRPGRRVPMPESNRFLPEEGEEVTLNGYWYARINDGDVERVPREEIEARAKAAAEALAKAETEAKAEAEKAEALAKAEAEKAANPPPPLPNNTKTK